MKMIECENIGEIYFGAYNDNSILEKSSSGGIFSACAKVIIELGGIVIGAVYNEEKYSIEHIAVDNYEAISKMRKSKYVWSDFAESIHEIESAIIDNRYVLFTGTPCQAAAIKMRFGNYDKLYVLDFFCHGTAEPKWFKEYLDTFDYRIATIDFRSNGKEDNFNFKYTYLKNDKTEAAFVSSWSESIFTRLYIESVVIRNVCFKCKYSDKKHVGDLTIGDFDFKDFARENGITAEHPSIIAVNTSKGKILWDAISNMIEHRKLLEKDKVGHYYQKHLTRGSWGYNWDKKKEFENIVKKEGFLKAAMMTCYPREVALIERIIGKTVYLYGAGKISKRIISIKNQYYANDINIKGIIVTESSIEKWICDIPVQSLNTIDINVLNNTTIVLAVGDKLQDEIYNCIKNIINEKNVIRY